jgi:hypothetical protein
MGILRHLGLKCHGGGHILRESGLYLTTSHKGK